MAGQGVAPCFLGYEPSVTLVHLPASVLNRPRRFRPFVSWFKAKCITIILWAKRGVGVRVCFHYTQGHQQSRTVTPPTFCNIRHVAKHPLLRLMGMTVEFRSNLTSSNSTKWTGKLRAFSHIHETKGESLYSRPPG